MPQPFDPTRTWKPAANSALRILQSIRHQKSRTQVCPKSPRLEGKLALVTGGTGGIGLEIVKGLASRGADVIAAARGTSASPDLDVALHSEGWGRITFLRLDLSAPNSIQQLVDDVRSLNPGRRIDILCANAGISPKRYEETAAGHESAFAVNCLGHHILIRSLIDWDILDTSARIVGTTGDIYILAKDCTKDFHYRGSGLQAYSRSKLGNLWQYKELSRHYPNFHTVIIHPGVVMSDLMGRISGINAQFASLFMITPELGAQASLIGATQDLPKESYFHNIHGRVELAPDDPAANDEKGREFWTLLESLAAPNLSDTTGSSHRG